MSEEIQVKRHGLFGKTVSYQTSLKLEEIEKHLHKNQDGRNPTSDDTVMPNKYFYIHFTTLLCEISSLQRIDRHLVLTLATAKGRIVREADSKITQVKFTIAIAWGLWFLLVLFISLFCLGLYLCSGSKNFFVGLVVTLVAIVGLWSIPFAIADELRKLEHLAHYIFKGKP